MSKQRASADERGSSADVTRLLRDLAARERQLRDLTEQSLGFLEELAESRRLNAEREQLVQRLAELERSLADARSRLRHAGGVAPAAASKGKKGGKRAPFEVVCWGVAPAQAQAIAAATDAPVSWVGLPDLVPGEPAGDRLAVVAHRDARTPAQCWNLGMASTSADSVVMLGPGAISHAPFVLPGELPANAAMLCPRIERDNGAECGQEPLDPLLRLRRRPVPAGAEAPFRVPFPAPEAFVVRRSAFERLGTFDEGFLGAAALVEYALRAQRANFVVLGVPALLVRGASAADPLPATGFMDRERLVVLAMHRPDLLAQALADIPLLWELPREEVAGFLAQLLAKLPTADGLLEQRAILERVALGLVQHGLPVGTTVGMLQSARVALLKAFAAAATGQSRDDFAAALRRAEGLRATDPTPALAGLVQDVQLAATAFSGMLRELERMRGEIRTLDAQRHDQSDRAERAEGARAQVQSQLEHVQQWLREAQAETSAVHEARAQALLKIEDVHRGAALVAAELAEVKRHRQNLEAQLKEAIKARDEREAQLKEAIKGRDEREAQLKEAIKGRDEREAQLKEAIKGRDERAAAIEELQRHKARVESALKEAEQSRAESAVRAERLQERLEAVQAQHRELEREYLATDTELRASREQIARIAGILGVVADANPANLHQRLEVVHQQAQQFASTLRTAGAADAASLLQRLDDLGQRLAAAERIVAERERWIGLLLQEVAQRRLFPRQLQEHERAIVDRMGRPS